MKWYVLKEKNNSQATHLDDSIDFVSVALNSASSCAFQVAQQVSPVGSQVGQQDVLQGLWDTRKKMDG